MPWGYIDSPSISSASAQFMRSFVQVKPRASTSEAPTDDSLSMMETTQEESEGNLSTLNLDAAVSIGYKICLMMNPLKCCPQMKGMIRRMM